MAVRAVPAWVGPRSQAAAAPPSANDRRGAKLRHHADAKPARRPRRVKALVRSLWWKLTVANVAVTLVGSLLAVMAFGPLLDERGFRDVVRPAHLQGLIEGERALLGGRLDDAGLALGLLQAMQQRLVNVDGPQGLYRIAYSSEPRVSLAVYGGDGRAAAHIDAPQLPLPATWLRSPEKLEAVSDAERLLVLPLQPEGMLVVRHHARFSVWKNLQSTLRDTGAYLWFLVLMVSIPGSVFGVGLTLWLARRLRRMAAVSDAWAKGDFGPRMDDRRPDELGTHALALNTMAARLDDHLKTEQALATLQERQRLARELHDSVKQQVFATGLQLHAAQQWLQRDPARADEALQRAQAVNLSVQGDLAEMLSRLKPADAAQPLGTLLQRALQPWAGQIETRVEAPEDLVVAGDTARELSRIVAEAAANAVRHAEARQLWVQVALQASELVLEVSDDGIGFDPAQAREGMGLASMRERAAQLPGGRLDLKSGAGGTTLVVRTRLPTTEGAT
jgi:NarL family two-component system sensor histidine kinase LiaS